MEPHEIENRLRRFAAEPLPEHLSRPPHGVVSPVANSSMRHTSRRPLMAAAAVAALALTAGVSFAAINGGSGPSVATSDAPPEVAPPAAVSDLVPEAGPLPERPIPAHEPGRQPAQVGDDETETSADDENDDTDRGPRVRPFEDDPCKGPPPFAGRPPVGDTDEEREANRAAEAAEHRLIRSNCPVDDGDADGQRRPDGSFPFEDDPCKGPPSWVIAGDDDERADVDGTHRADEARRHAEIRAACRGGDVDGRNATGRPDHAGPPEGVPSGPPEDRPGGPPEDRPGGPPEGVPSGPPEDRRTGPPEDRPGGPPEGVGGGPPGARPGGPTNGDG